MSLREDASSFFNYQMITPIECHLKFRRFMLFEDTVLYVRQPNTYQNSYQVLFEDAYGNHDACLMTQEEIKEKYKIEL